MNEEIKSILNKLNDIFVDENTGKMSDVIQLILYLVDDEINERKKLETQIDELKSKIERMRNRVDGIESDQRRC
jgi:TolA-binding protein